MKNIFLSLLFIFSLFAISRFIFEPTYLYYEIKNLDVPMHILGGLGFATLFVSLLNYQKKEITFKKLIISVLVIGIIWEIYEYSMYYFLGRDWGGMVDTIKDLINDFIGGTIIYSFIKKDESLFYSSTFYLLVLYLLASILLIVYGVTHPNVQIF